MFSTDNLFFLVIFLVPCAVYIVFNRYLRPVPSLEKDEAVKISSALLFGFVVFGIISFIIGELYILFLSQETIFDNIDMLIFVVVCNVVLSFVLCIIWLCAKKIILIPVINLFNRMLKRPIESTHETVWDYLVETKGLIDINCCIVAIESDEFTTRGQVAAFPASITERTEFILVNTQKIETLFANDALKEEENKIFGKINYVYLDTSNNLRITFYDTEKYKANLFFTGSI